MTHTHDEPALFFFISVSDIRKKYTLADMLTRLVATKLYTIEFWLYNQYVSLSLSFIFINICIYAYRKFEVIYFFASNIYRWWRLNIYVCGCVPYRNLVLIFVRWEISLLWVIIIIISFLRVEVRKNKKIQVGTEMQSNTN